MLYAFLRNFYTPQNNMIIVLDNMLCCLQKSFSFCVSLMLLSHYKFNVQRMQRHPNVTCLKEIYTGVS